MENLTKFRAFFKETFSNLVKNDSKLKIFLTVLGGLIVLRKSLSLSSLIYKNFLRASFDLQRRYGPSSYVFISGGLNSFGKAFAEEFSKKGFNILIFSLEISSENAAFCDELKTRYKVDVLILNSFESLENYDVSVLVNNSAEFSKYCKFTEISENRVNKYLDDKILTKIPLIRDFLRKFSLRSKKSAIITVSSFSSQIPLASFSIDSASNAFLDVFSRSLAYENENIDIISLKPLFITKDEKNIGIRTVSPGNSVRGCLRDLGHENSCYGDIWHKFQAERFLSMPEEKQERYYSHYLKKILAIKDQGF